MIEALEMTDIGSSTLYIAGSDIMKLKVSRWIYPLWALKSFVHSECICISALFVDLHVFHFVWEGYGWL